MKFGMFNLGNRSLYREMMTIMSNGRLYREVMMIMMIVIFSHNQGQRQGHESPRVVKFGLLQIVSPSESTEANGGFHIESMGPSLGRGHLTPNPGYLAKSAKCRVRFLDME